MSDEKVLLDAVGEILGEVQRDMKTAMETSTIHLEDRIQEKMSGELKALRTDMQLKGELGLQTEKAISDLEDSLAHLDENLKSQINSHRSALESELTDRLKHLDGNELLKSELVSQQRGDIAAMRLYLSNLSRKSERISSTGAPSKILQKSIEGGL